MTQGRLYYHFVVDGHKCGLYKIVIGQNGNKPLKLLQVCYCFCHFILQNLIQNIIKQHLQPAIGCNNSLDKMSIGKSYNNPVNFLKVVPFCNNDKDLLVVLLPSPCLLTIGGPCLNIGDGKVVFNLASGISAFRSNVFGLLQEEFK